ncbi:hypothetical protein QN277_011258 [Acacia crassicarpa]|uniref:RING-type E3 ubiquitin transferase n=1 Tax=Acacia crassicarpa TaxID=499986 RepID=A0AAE1TBB8_9FABA|nr:hypothetical protein QN277_011258 [Acacia crassicarpa]
MSSNTSDSYGSKPLLSGYAYYYIGLTSGILLIFAFIAVTLYLCSRRIAMNPSWLSQVRNASFDLRTINIGAPPATNSPVQLGVDDETLNTYPMLLYSKVKRDRKGGAGCGAATCSICLGDFTESEWLRELPDCRHLFHQKCIDIWLRMNTSCPLCRTSPLPTPVSTPLAEVAPLARSGA